MTSFDLIGAIELAYDRTSDEETWLADVTRMIAPEFGCANGAPVNSFVYDLTDDYIRLGAVAGVGKNRYERQNFERAIEDGARHGPVRRAYECDMYTLLSRVVGVEQTKSAMAAAGMVGGDSLGLRANATPRTAIMLTTQVPEGHRLRNRELWTRFASHLGAALRLRRTKVDPSPDSARAVLSPSGRLEQGDDDTVAARDQLGTAAKALDRARGKLRRLDSAAAVALWRTMVGGEWSLVDWYDHDGKRFLLAQENRIPSPSRHTLPPREEQVVACAAMGHSNKLIAYDLGLSIGSVSVLIGRAARKLGVSGRVALVRAFKDAPPLVKSPT